MSVRFAAIGLAHAHIHGQTAALLAAGAELVAFHAAPDEPAEDFARAFPPARRVDDMRAILEDPAIALVACASPPARLAEIAIACMRHGKDVLVDKPAAITLAELARLREVQAQTRRILAVWFSERLAVRACTLASELVQAGAIGRVLQTVGLGPHRLGPQRRPAWAYRRDAHGGILADLASHQVEQFLHYTGSTSAAVVSAHAANLAHPGHPQLQDFGEALLAGDGGRAYLRVDWCSADGLPTWGDGRLTILGSEGHIELRKTVDLAGRPGGEHLFLVDRRGVRHVDCRDQPLPYAGRLLDDVRARGETAMPQAHTFLAVELALRAQALADAATERSA